MMLKSTHGRRLLKQANVYLNETIGVVFELVHASLPSLPYYLKDRFDLASAKLLGRPILLAVPLGPDAERRLSGKTLGPLSNATNGQFVLLLNGVSAPERRSLIKSGYSFIVPGLQLYVPSLGIDLNERFPRPKSESAEQLSPTAQLLLIAQLLGHPVSGSSASSLARRYRFSAMSMSRAFDELEQLELATFEFRGKAKHIFFNVPSDALFNKCKSLLRSPIRKVRAVTQQPGIPMLLSGESALSNWTMINSPSIPVFAIPATMWKDVANYSPEASAWDQRAAYIETWSYDPKLLSESHTVDKLSLWLTVRDSRDPRIEEAADQLLEQVGL